MCARFLGPAGIFAVSVFLAIILLGIPLGIVETRRLRAIAATRSDDSICTFARAFDCRSLDTAIIRAVHEELQHYFEGVTPFFPIRPTDNFDSDLKLDLEDLEDIAKVVALRANRTLDGSKLNPFYARIRTVSDFVQFFSGQPVTAAAGE